MNRLLAIVVLVTVGTALPSTAARAGFITNHASAGFTVQVFAEGDSRTASDGQQGELYASVLGGTGAGGPTASATGGAFAEAGFPVIGTGRVFASATASAGTGVGGIAATADVDAGATWMDIVFLTPPAGGTLPSVVRLTFEAFGSLSSPGLSPTGAAGVGRVQAFASGFGGVSVVTDTLDVQTTGSFRTTLQIDIPLGSTGVVGPGSASWFFTVVAEAFAATGIFSPGSASASADGDPALSQGAFLTAVTLPEFGNQTPEALGYTVTFDSGGPSPNAVPGVAAVPEPASLALFGIGAAGVAGYARRRRAVTP